MPRTAKSVNISLPPQLFAFLETMAAEGGYGSVSAVMQEALRDLQRKTELHALKVEQLKAALDAGYADIDAGRVYDHDDAMALLEERRAERARRRKEDVA